MYLHQISKLRMDISKQTSWNMYPYKLQQNLCYLGIDICNCLQLHEISKKNHETLFLSERENFFVIQNHFVTNNSLIVYSLRKKGGMIDVVHPCDGKPLPEPVRILYTYACMHDRVPINTLRPRQNGRHYTDDTFKPIFVNENVWILIKISLKFVPKGPINNIPALV